MSDQGVANYSGQTLFYSLLDRELVQWQKSIDTVLTVPGRNQLLSDFSKGKTLKGLPVDNEQLMSIVLGGTARFEKLDQNLVTPALAVELILLIEEAFLPFDMLQELGCPMLDGWTLDSISMENKDEYIGQNILMLAAATFAAKQSELSCWLSEN